MFGFNYQSARVRIKMTDKGDRVVAAKVLAALQVGTNGSLGKLLGDCRERPVSAIVQEL